jgi:hemerythrin-like metal-binding protein
MAIEWSKDLELGIPEIDEQNIKFFAMYEDFSREIEQGTVSRNMEELLGFLDGYARDLFKYEEYLLEKSAYEGLAEHVAKHRGFMNEIRAFEKRLLLEGSTHELALDIKRVLMVWLLTHVRKMDRDFVSFLLDTQTRNARDMAKMKLGEMLVEEGHISQETLTWALEKQKTSKESIGAILQEAGAVSAGIINKVVAEQKWNNLMSKKLGEILLEFGLITQASLNHALMKQKETGKKLGVTLVEMGIITPKQIIEVQAIQKGILKR